ncbi:right-handed parallel beta-helix repeat-containing protein [Tamlana crocina]|uniref:Right-handed parallel beta-helix repeat-containing protein n=1 Tax=Tamlana crocina TaxID=393006 RepID=A0ABX1DD78_9FLAO|nr:right-handed parallel beta-helix repeat-containing protein [Tamlana crocina]NJX14578.1 right-handed parallel beta-helix repeat-containing protein [Tamlana crocina]
MKLSNKHRNLVNAHLFDLKKCIITFTFLSGLCCILSAQSVYVVDNNQGSGAEFTSLQAAIDAAAANDIIYVQPSPNGYGNINMTKPITIYGLGHIPELNAGQYASVSNIFFRSANASGSKLSGLYINNIYLDNTTYTNHDVVITNNRVAYIVGNSTTTQANNVVISGNYIRNANFNAIDPYNSQNWIVSNNIIEQPNTSATWGSFNRFNSSIIFNNNIVLTRQNGNGSGAIQLFANCSGTQITNNIFLFKGTSVSNFNLGSNNALSFQNNLTYNYNGTLDVLSGSGNIDNADPQFVAFNSNASLNTTASDYHIQTGSPAENAGTDGNDLGVYNGGFPFSPRGYPTELPYLTDFVIFNNIITPGSTLNVNIKANANLNN